MAAWISPWQISDEPTFWPRERWQYCSVFPPPASWRDNQQKPGPSGRHTWLRCKVRKVIENAVDLCQYLLDEALISTVPGEAYNVPGKIRISYSNSMENLEKALDRLEHALVQLK